MNKLVAVLSQQNKSITEDYNNLNKQYQDQLNQGPIEVPVIEYKDRKVIEVRENTEKIREVEKRVANLLETLDTCGQAWKEAYYITKKELEKAVADTLFEDKLTKSFAGYDFEFSIYSKGLEGLSFETKPALIPAAFKCQDSHDELPFPFSGAARRHRPS